MNVPMPIPEVSALVARCWMIAEKHARDLIAKKYHDEPEECITNLFRGEFRQTVDEANSTEAVHNAFLHDLESAFPYLPHSDVLKNLANGISATTTWHPHGTESKSGGDLGIVLVRPNITDQGSSLYVEDNYQCGLLCQAKINIRADETHKPKWHGFSSKNQKDVLSTRLNYLSLLLYEYADVERHFLKPFGWQLCHDYKFHEVEGWLNSGQFPERLTSEEIITLLAKAEIGTDDKQIIKECIGPSVRDTLIVKIGWPPGKKPPAQIQVSHKMEQEQQHIHLYQQ